MHCPNCETVVEHALKSLPGVRRAEADYGTETVIVTYDNTRTNLFRIFQALETKGYECTLMRRRHPWREGVRKLLQIILGLLGMIAIFYVGTKLPAIDTLPDFGRQASAGLLFLAGLLTSFHCVGMCGGFIVGYTARSTIRGKHSYAWSHVAYGLGKTLSYAMLGGLCGLAGSLITFTPTMKGAAAIAAGFFLMGFGLNMLHLLPHLHWFGFTMPPWLSRFVHAEFRKHHSAFTIGLLNGLMIACGPLQAMYIMAAGTGSPWEGAKVLFMFGAGTLPLLMGFGFLTSMISHQTSEKLLKASGLIVVALGLIMLNRGLVLTGSGYDFRALSAWISTATDVITERYESSQTTDGTHQTIRMEVTGEGFQPATFVLRKGIPVRWIIIGKELNECNRAIIVPKLGLQFDIRAGEQVVEFTPKDDGTILWSCWMGMIRGTFVVIDASSTPGLTQPPESKTTAEQPSWSPEALWQRLKQWFDRTRERLGGSLTGSV